MMMMMTTTTMKIQRNKEDPKERVQDQVIIRNHQGHEANQDKRDKIKDTLTVMMKILMKQIMNDH